MKYAWGVKGGGKGQGGNWLLIFPHLRSFIIITGVNYSTPFTKRQKKEEAKGRGWKKKVRRVREQEVREIWAQFREIKQQAQGITVPDFGNSRGKREGWRETGCARATRETGEWFSGN